MSVLGLSLSLFLHWTFKATVPFVLGHWIAAPELKTTFLFLCKFPLRKGNVFQTSQTPTLPLGLKYECAARVEEAPGAAQINPAPNFLNLPDLRGELSISVPTA